MGTLFILYTVHLWSNNITRFTGQEKPPEQDCELTPSSRGRQRKKNPKYFDYETEEDHVKAPRKSSGGRGRAASKKTPAKNGKAKNAGQQAVDGEEEGTDKTPQESDGKTSEETPKKVVRAKKTPTKKTPAKKTPAKKTPAKKTPTTGEGGVVDTVQQENGTPTPKTKNVRKRRAKEVEPITEPPCKEDQGEPPIEPEEEILPGGRRRRGAAKA